MPDTRTLKKTIDDLISDVADLPDRTALEDVPGVLQVLPDELRELLECHFYDLVSQKPFNGLSNSEAERLALLVEEMGEAAQSVGKILRHGYESAHPDGGPNNRQSLERELGDVRHCMQRLAWSGDVSRQAVHDRADEKLIQVNQYLHHQ
jgi:NTP pyrophosphatase (non-canonical NTP hydrolase)